MTEREKWLARRREGIGGSDAAAILGLNPWKSALSVYLDKIGEGDEVEESEAMLWGNRLESVIKERYQEVTGRALQGIGDYHMVSHWQYPWLLATPDDIIGGEWALDSGPGIFEAKTASVYSKGDWDNGPPIHYYAQLQHYLAATGYSWGSFGVLIGGQDFRWMDVERDEQFIEQLIEAEKTFWEGVKSKKAPSPDGSSSARKALGKIFPVDTGEEIELGEEADALDRSRLELDNEIKHLEGQVKELRGKKSHFDNQLKSMIGNASVAVLPSGVSYSWKASTRKAYEVAERTTRTLRRRKAK